MAKTETSEARRKHNEKYPEHVKLRAVKDDSQKLGAFLDWLQEQGIALYHDEPEPLAVCLTTEKLLAKYFEIDLDKIETEKRAMLEEQRQLNERTSR
jgi:hypothetical protein